MTVKERFWSRVNKTDGCWYWTGAKRQGYGLFYDGKSTGAHRWSYTEAFGSIPPRHQVDHTCHNTSPDCSGGITCLHRSCVNPAHLEAVPPRTNTIRSRHTGPGANVRKTHCSSGHPLEQVMHGDREYRECQECRRKYERERKMRKRRDEGIPAGRGVRESMKTHCPRGHIYDAANTYITTTGGRACRKCGRDRRRTKKVPDLS